MQKMNLVSKIIDNSYLFYVFRKFRNINGYLKHHKIYNKEINAPYNPIPKEKIVRYNFSRLFGPLKYICYAPFNSLFFDIRGKVVVCNQNREYVIGDINKQSIHEIWFSDERKEIQDFISNYDFSKGCQKCADAILSNNLNGLPAISYDSTPEINKYPIRMEFEISNTCNLACLMCNSYISSTYRKHFENKEPYKSVYTSVFVNQLIEFIPHLQYTKFSGGEPFLVDLYYDIWNKLIELNPTCGIHIQTNGLVLNNKVKSILEKGNFYIGISLDGASKKTFEDIRLYGNFDKLTTNILYFKEYCNRKKTLLNFPFTPNTLNMYEVPQFPEFANKYEATCFFNILWEPHAIAIWTLDSTKLIELYEYYEKQKLIANNHIELKNKKQFDYFKNQVKTWIINAQKREQEYLYYEKLTNNQLIQTLVDKLVEYDNGTYKNWFTDEPVNDTYYHYNNIFYKKLEENPEKIRLLLIKMNTYDIERVHIEVNNYFHLH